MRQILLLAIFVLAFATRGAGNASDGVPLANATMLVGSWSCTGSAPGSTGEERYGRTRNGALELRDDVQTSWGVIGVVDETFLYDRTNARWTLHAAKNRFFDEERLSAHPWTGSHWIFTGTQIVGRAASPVRIIYTALGTDVFRREHQARIDGVWRANGAFLCKRVAAIASAPSAPTARPHPSETPRSIPRVTRAAPRASLADRAYALLGRWSCVTRGGIASTHTYARWSADAFTLDNVVRVGDRSYTIRELYRFEPSEDLWLNATQDDAYNGTAAPWRQTQWLFEGSVPAGSRRLPVRMIYSELSTREFQRDFEKFDGGAWSSFASETCRRT